MSASSTRFYQPSNGTSFTSTGAPLSIQLGFTPYEVHVYNNSSIINLTTTATTPFDSFWNVGLPANSARILASAGTAAAGSAQPVLASYVSTNGILVSSTSQVAYTGSYTGTAFTAANPAAITGIVAASGSPALVTGQTGILWLSKATGASQWANAFYNFTATSTTAITLTGVNNSAFAAGTAVSFTIVQNIGSQLAQTSQVITSIASASTTTTTVVMANNVGGWKVGNYIHFSIPSRYGTMARILDTNNASLINNLGGYQITAVSGNTLTVAAATSGGTFTYPTDAVVQASLGKTFQKPTATPAGVVPTIYNQPQAWTGSVYLTLGTSVVGLSGNSLWVNGSQIVVQ
jgi:hypothetical protein